MMIKLESGFLICKDEKFKLNVLSYAVKDNYYANCLDFNLVGEGKNRQEAVADLIVLIFSYLKQVKSDIHKTIHIKSDSDLWALYYKNMKLQKMNFQKFQLINESNPINENIISNIPAYLLEDYNKFRQSCCSL